MSYQVFIERAKQPGSEAQVAAAIAQHYGLPEAAVAKRLSAGRFRVKADIDRAAAEDYAKQLDTLGAVATIIGPDGNMVTAASAVVDGPLAGAAPSSRAPVQQGPQLPAQKSSNPANAMVSGLAAAGSGGEQDLGALGSGELSLSTVDGAEEPAATPPAAATVKDAGPPVPPPTDDSAFMPPDSVTEEVSLAVDLAVVPGGPPPPQPTSGSDGEVGVPGFIGVTPTDDDEPEPEVERTGFRAMAHYLSIRPRATFMTAVLFGVLVGFVPAASVTIMQEGSALEESRANMNKVYDSVATVDEWNSLGDALADEENNLNAKRRKAALTGSVVWVLLAAALWFLWARVLPWHRWAEVPPESDPEPELG